MFTWHDNDDESFDADADEEASHLILDSARIPAQEIAPRCGCGGELEVVAEIREGYLCWDVESTTIDLNSPDFFSGVLGPVTITCKECGQEAQVDLRIHPWTTAVSIEDEET